MSQQHSLNLRCRDVLARPADDVLLALDEVQHAVGIAGHDVAGMEPAAPPGRFGRRVVLEIAREAAAAWRLGRMTDHQLAGPSVGDVAVLVIDDARLDAGHGAAEGPGTDLTR